jgi:hypothetical protein
VRWMNPKKSGRRPATNTKVPRCLIAERPRPLIARRFPQRVRSQGRPWGAASAGLPLDYGKSVGNGELSANAVAFGLRLFLGLASS